MSVLYQNWRLQGYTYFSLLLQYIDCSNWYSLEPPRCVPTINVFSKNIKNINIFASKFSVYVAEKNLCIFLHGQVFVMYTQYKKKRKVFIFILSRKYNIFSKSKLF